MNSTGWCRSKTVGNILTHGPLLPRGIAGHCFVCVLLCCASFNTNDNVNTTMNGNTTVFWVKWSASFQAEVVCVALISVCYCRWTARLSSSVLMQVRNASWSGVGSLVLHTDLEAWLYVDGILVLDFGGLHSSVCQHLTFELDVDIGESLCFINAKRCLLHVSAWTDIAMLVHGGMYDMPCTVFVSSCCSLYFSNLWSCIGLAVHWTLLRVALAYACLLVLDLACWFTVRSGMFILR